VAGHPIEARARLRAWRIILRVLDESRAPPATGAGRDVARISTKPERPPTALRTLRVVLASHGPLPAAEGDGLQVARRRPAGNAPW
jgi:hypothetical protein